jgi:hypothetical protein
VAAYAGEAAIRAFLDVLEEQCSAYCILGRCDDLPAGVHSDIDFMVSREDYARLPQIMQMLAQRTGFRLVRERRHEQTGHRFDLARTEAGRVLYLSPDACSDYRRHGRCWLRCGQVLAQRRRHRNGFWIPRAADQFLYYLIKRLEKQSLEAVHSEELGRLFAEDPKGCAGALGERLSAASAGLVAAAARSGDWQPVRHGGDALFQELLASASTDSLAWRLVGNPLRLARLWLRPAGLWVAFAETASTEASPGAVLDTESYADGLRALFRGTQRFHAGPRSVAGTSGQMQSAARLLREWMDSVLAYCARIRPQLARSVLMVMEGGEGSQPPRGLARMLAAITPRPELVFKRELTRQELARATPDAISTPAAAMHDSLNRTLDLLARRTARALGLDRN